MRTRSRAGAKTNGQQQEVDVDVSNGYESMTVWTIVKSAETIFVVRCLRRKMNFTLVRTLLYIYSWISVSVSEFHTVEVQRGEDVTLNCTNFTSIPSHIIWFKLGSEPNITRISFMTSSDGIATICDGFQNGRFTMTSNIVTVFLNIKHVDLSDYGLYFCGFNENRKPVIVHATYLNVTQEVFGGSAALVSVILGGVITVLIVIMSQVLKIIRPHEPPGHGQNPQHSETLGSDNLNYAAVNLKLKPKTNHRPASDRELETDVVYVATR
ncbi:uncharacterized protein LOC114845446 [Betta splendens]|uniref:Uncharacterized protein LOC114845446 n=1 Tax=Betta splendens TaxID=158456 RepID=A0A9W2XM07_BETSP|nr:uncharacterized protein LOC114845446 [Betta splendens]